LIVRFTNLAKMMPVPEVKAIRVQMVADRHEAAMSERLAFQNGNHIKTEYYPTKSEYGSTQWSNELPYSVRTFSS